MPFYLKPGLNRKGSSPGKSYIRKFFRIGKTGFLLTVFLFTILPDTLTAAKTLNGHLLNRPLADNKAVHLGFSVGMQFQELHFYNNGDNLYDGSRWFADQPSASPGFCVNGLVDFRLNNFFNFRINPGLYFGSKSFTFTNEISGEQKSQTLKSTYLVIPLDLKFSSIRYRNARPYVSAGIMPAIDLTARKGDLLQLKTFDCYLTVGIGCDFYLPYFKLIPELKFCFGLSDMLRHDRPDLVDDPVGYRYTQALKKVTSSMVVLTFYFE